MIYSKGDYCSYSLVQFGAQRCGFGVLLINFKYV